MFTVRIVCICYAYIAKIIPFFGILYNCKVAQVIVQHLINFLPR